MGVASKYCDHSSSNRKLALNDNCKVSSAWWTYTITSRSWGNYATPINTTIEYGVKNGVDLNTGSVWIPGGNNNGTQMVMNVPGLSALPTFDMPLNYFPVPITHHSWTWSSVRNSFLHYGGRSVIGNITNPKLTEFSPLAGWAAVVTTGQPPGDVSGHCMVPDGIARADIYILDVPTRVWKMGKAATPEHARRYMACAVAGDSFVAWGGENDGLNMEVTPIVYDLVNDEWTTQFRRENLLKSATPFTPSPTATPIDTGSSKSTNAAAIGGGIAGGIVVVIIVVGLLLYRRRKQHRANVDRNINIVINNNNSIEKNEENTSPREPQDTDAQWYNKRNMYDTNAGVQPPPLKPHPVDNRDTFFKRFSTSPLTSPSLAGPQALMREPHKHLQSQSISSVKGYKTELVEDDEEIEQQRPLMPARLSNLSGTTAIVPPQTLPSNNSGPVKDVHNIEKNSNVATASITSRSPQTPTGVYLSYEGEGNRAAQTPRDPHSKSDIHSTIPDNVSAVQNQNPGDSLYIDRNDYLNRTQELSRMMDHIRAEQEELERSRREHEASMQRFNETQSFT
ncbi:hypothetical protein FBU30_003489 [Linnemannia zychae]|nr:hypothetical protein FBU30_003489 [Linnemannia zychae]